MSIEKIERFFDKMRPISKGEKDFFLSYLKSGDLGGISSKDLLEIKKDEYLHLKRYIMADMVDKLLGEVRRGVGLAEALQAIEVITESEYLTLTKSRSLSAGIDRITEKKKEAGGANGLLLLFFVPPIGITHLLLWTHGQVKDVLLKMTEPLREMTTKSVEIPGYLLDPTTYYIYGGLLHIILFGSIITFIVLKKINVPMYLKFLPYRRYEYTIDILHTIKSLKEAGISLSDSVKISIMGENDKIKLDIYKDIELSLKTGKGQLADILAKYHLDFTSIGFIRTGEKTKRFDQLLSIAEGEIKDRYERILKKLHPIAKFGGQVAMLGIAFKPMVDIMILTSIGQMDFEV